MNSRARYLHDTLPVVDLVSPLATERPSVAIPQYMEGGASVVGFSVAPFRGGAFAEGCRGIEDIRSLIDGDPRLRLVLGSHDAWEALRHKQLGVVIHAQGPFIERPRDLTTLHRLGLRVLQPAYNISSPFADGCNELRDAGLTAPGRDLVRQMNKLGVVVDGSHMGRRSTLEMLRVSTAPPILSHSGCAAVHPHRRNVDDAVLRAIIELGGVVGVPGIPYFLGEGVPTLEHLLAHIEHVLALAGSADHVALGLDYFTGVRPYSSARAQARADRAAIASGLWLPGQFAPVPNAFAPEIRTPAKLRNLTAALLSRLDEGDVAKIISLNWLRILDAASAPR